MVLYGTNPIFKGYKEKKMALFTGDSETGGNNWKNRFDQITKNGFFTFSGPYLDFIGKGEIFNLVYVVMAVINLLLPFAVIFVTVKSGVLKYGGAKFTIAFILSCLVIAFACWIGFQLWWNRRSHVANSAASEFIATPIFSRILQTFGEWLGTLIGILGAGVGIIASIFLGNDANNLFRLIGLRFMRFGPMVIIIGPIIGFFIIIIFRFVAEQLRILAALANNTKEIATNLISHEKANGAPSAPPEGLSQTTTAYVVKEKMKLYKNRGDYSIVVCVLNPGENVTYLETGSTVSVKGIPAPMFYIKTTGGEQGWCYSGFLELKG
jgi:hypothetical protein